MHELFEYIFNNDEKDALRHLVSTLKSSSKQYFLRNEISQAYADYCYQSEKPAYFYHSSSIGKLISYTHEIILEDNSIWFVVRPRIAIQEVWWVADDLNHFELKTPQALLDVRDRLRNSYQPLILEIDVTPFYKIPSISDPRNIGQGLSYLNHYLCNELLNDRDYWLEVLFKALQRIHYDETPLLIGSNISNGTQLAQQAKLALEIVNQQPPDEPYEKFKNDLQALGLEPGWGNTALRVRETLELFQRLIENPESAILEAFVSRIPAVFRVVVVSIHGWLAQEDVLGRTETAGQVAYVLEQTQNLEHKLREDIELAGLTELGIKPQIIILTRLIPNCEGTNCNLKREKVTGTENAWIVRVPFREFNPEVTQNWISKYEIWPYLETFALDAEQEILTNLGGRPNLIIGNYSDGNLVGFLLARRLKVTQCNIAHSLEKPKHLFSNLYWQNLEEQYHFSAQFTADLISMNAADIIITSSYQEIVGTPDKIGQYESYKCFTMPHLYHVVNGIDLLSSKFNMIAPGVDEEIFFPYTETERRSQSVSHRVHDLIFTQEDPHVFGKLEDQNKRPILAVSPITSIKNLSGLVECFGQSQELQEYCNLIIVTNKLYVDELSSEEKGEIQRIQDAIEQYQLQEKIRWLGMRLPNIDLGEAYRLIADKQGIFVHFASFEAFGRTILEAMVSGLPSFITEFGGASEIIDVEEDRFHINPTDLEGTAKKILYFIDQCINDTNYWQQTSEWVIQQIRNKYNWNLHTKQLLLISKIYGFWDFATQENQEALLHYLDALYHLMYKPRTEKILEEHMQR
jgi:sucrose synthase